METILFIINLLIAITLITFMIVLLLDVKKRYNLKLTYARLICISIFILLDIAKLITQIIMKESITLTVVTIILWVANLLVTIACIKSYKRVNIIEENLSKLETDIENSIKCE